MLHIHIYQTLEKQSQMLGQHDSVPCLVGKCIYAYPSIFLLT